MHAPLFVADRRSLEAAADLMTRFGALARAEAATRANSSREIGNVIAFCRWRQVERMIAALALTAPIGTLH